MVTTYLVIDPAGTTTTRAVEWPEFIVTDAIKGLVEPLLGEGEPLEHVSVRYNGKRRDMFVSELGAATLTTRGPLPVNVAATTIYRTAWMLRYPDSDPGDLPTIRGVAVLFPDREVWT